MTISQLKTFACLAAILLGGPGISRCKADLTSFEAGTGEVQGGWQLTLQLEKAAYQIGEPVTAIVTFKNASDTVQTLIGSLADAFDVTFIVSRERERAEIEPWGRANRAGSEFPHSFAPGDARVYRIRLDERMDLARSGTYAVTAARMVPVKPTSAIPQGEPRSFDEQLDRFFQTYRELKSARYEKLRSANLLVRINESGTPRQADPSTSGTEPSASTAMPDGIAGIDKINRSPESGVNGSTPIEPSSARFAPPAEAQTSSATIRPRISQKLVSAVIALLAAMIGWILWRAARRTRRV